MLQAHASRMMEFCTYFDQRYLPRALALYHSLERQCPGFRLHALCLDDVTYHVFSAMCLDSLQPHRLTDLLARDCRLEDLKASRAALDFYLTLTPSWLLHVLEAIPADGLLTYLDADVYLFSSPAPLFEELEAMSVGLVPHHYARGRSGAAGRFNTGFLTVRNDERAHDLLARWRDQCIEWCEFRFDGERYGDQKYLDEWQGMDGVHEFTNPGSHFGPWSLEDMRVTRGAGGGIEVGGSPLIVFHFSKFSRVNRLIYEAGFTYFGARADKPVRDLIYRPYVQEVDRCYELLAQWLLVSEPLRPVARAGVWRFLPFGARLRRWARAGHHIWQGTVNRGYIVMWHGRAV